MKSNSTNILTILVLESLAFLIASSASGSSLKEGTLLNIDETRVAQNVLNGSCADYPNEDIVALREEKQNRLREINDEISIIELIIEHQEEYEDLFNEFEQLNTDTLQSLEDIEGGIFSALGKLGSSTIRELMNVILIEDRSTILPTNLRETLQRYISRISSYATTPVSLIDFLVSFHDALADVRTLESEYNMNRDEIFALRDQLVEQIESLQASLNPLDSPDALRGRVAELKIDRAYLNAEVARLERCIDTLPSEDDAESSPPVATASTRGNQPYFEKVNFDMSSRQELAESEEFSYNFSSAYCNYSRDDNDEEVRFINSSFLVNVAAHNQDFGALAPGGILQVNLQGGDYELLNNGRKVAIFSVDFDQYSNRVLGKADINRDQSCDYFGLIHMSTGGGRGEQYYYVGVLLSQQTSSGSVAYVGISMPLESFPPERIGNIEPIVWSNMFSYEPLCNRGNERLPPGHVDQWVYCDRDVSFYSENRVFYQLRYR